MRSTTVRFTKEQVKFLMRKTGSDDPNEAIDIFSQIIKLENIDPSKMITYLNKLMEKEGSAK